MFRHLTGTLGMILPGESGSQPYEWFTITANPDTTHTLRVVTKSPDASLVRDSSQTFDAAWAPTEGYVRLIRDGAFLGSVVRRVEGRTVHSFLFGPDGSVTRGEQDLLPGMTFGFHSVASNPWKFAQHSGGSGPEPLPVLTHSLTWNGGTVGLGDVSHTRLELVGRETITVPAGTFECDHHRWYTEVDGQIDVWSTGEDKVYVRGHQADRGITYELTSLSSSDAVAPTP